ncbi:translation elongation factor Ts [Candidatus Endowatersipora endosymbiont of Watersipora subatra]|uniref:translation elongation factor Ts n=1 Tax=Candidatus Endowatersipora endosymbiont of Watersipora subatra TaxID=3077946 RepID=UPI00312CBEEB
MALFASMIRELREKTGAGMMDCKIALKENKNDILASIDWLRKKGIAKAEKKSGRLAAEGLVAVMRSGSKGAIIEVNSETDFVARNKEFQELVLAIAKTAIKTDGTLESIKGARLEPHGKSITNIVKESISTIGENISLRRAAVMNVSQGLIALYVHNSIGDGLGKIGVLVALESSGDVTVLNTIGHQIAMHVAAATPIAATKDDINHHLVEREKEIFSASARESGKPENIIEKMVQGRIQKFYEENVLLSQTFVIDRTQTVEQALRNAEKNAGSTIRLKGFVRFELGEGIKRED